MAAFYQTLLACIEARRPACIVMLLGPGALAGTRLLLGTDGALQGELPDGPLGNWLLEGTRRALAARRTLTLETPGGPASGCTEGAFEPYPPRPALFILGGGHIGKAVYDLTAPLGLFDLCIVDDRPAYSDPERFPAARTVCCAFPEVFEHLAVAADSFVLIVTRGHRADRVCLEGALRTPAAYIGMIGSRRKVALTYKLLGEAGFGRPDFARVHAPVGLALGAIGAGEIAVSILAELIAVKNGVDPAAARSLSVTQPLPAH